MAKSVYVVYGVKVPLPEGDPKAICTAPLYVSTTKAYSAIWAMENGHTLAGFQLKIDEFTIGGNGTKRKPKVAVATPNS